MRSFLIALSVVVPTVACSSGGSPSTTADAPVSTIDATPGNTIDAAPGTPDATPVAPESIHTLRTSLPADSTPVALANVIITATVESHKSGSIWVQDQGGGMYSGIHVFCNYGGTHPNCSMTEAQFEALAIGDVVSLTGTFSNYTPSTPAGAPPEIEIDSPNITNAGTTMTPTPVDVTAATLISTQATASGAAPYDGAYVHLTGGPFTVSSVSAAEYSATCTSSAGVAGTTFDGFEATSGGNTFDIGLTYYYNVTYCLPDCGYACTNQVTAAEAFSSISGIVEPESNATGGQVYLQISPTQDSDLVKM